MNNTICNNENNDNIIYKCIIIVGVLVIIFMIIILIWNKMYKCNYDAPKNFKASEPILSDNEKYSVILSWDKSNAPLYSMYKGQKNNFEVKDGYIIMEKSKYNGNIQINNLEKNSIYYFMIYGTNIDESCKSIPIYINVNTFKNIKDNTKVNKNTNNLNTMIKRNIEGNIGNIKTLNVLNEMINNEYINCHNIINDVKCVRNFQKK